MTDMTQGNPVYFIDVAVSILLKQLFTILYVLEDGNYTYT
jgi:hypothetical protein